VAGFLLVAVPVTLVMFAARTLRWVAVAGLSFRLGALWHSHLQTALAVGVAMLTPAQVGEALKMKLVRDADGKEWATLGAAFVIERLADLAALTLLLVIWLGHASIGWLAVAGLGMAAAVALLPALLRRVEHWPLPTPVAHALLPLGSFRPAPWRMCLFALGTFLNWGCVLLLWQAVLGGAGVWLSLAECALAVSLVTFAVIASMVPGGIGVAELSAWRVFSWLGVAAGQAEAGSVLLRLITAVVAAMGLLHGLALLFGGRARRST
jgi:hypothetical protein